MSPESINCPFYGYGLFRLEGQYPFTLINQFGNRCALVTGSHSPCQMEIAGEPPDWRTCSLLAAVRCEER